MIIQIAITSLTQPTTISVPFNGTYKIRLIQWAFNDYNSTPFVFSGALNTVVYQRFLSIDIDNINKFLPYYHINKDDFYYELFELELRLRALRDCIENG